MGLWLILIAAFVAYVFADAAFDISKKISRFIRFGALPWIRGAWGAVWGRLPARAAPAVALDAPTPSASSDGAETPKTDHHFDAGQNRWSIDFVRLAAFLWKAKWAILIAVIFVSGVALMRGCTPIWAKSRDTLRAELKEARASEAVSQHEALIASKAIVLAEETHRDRSRREAVIAQAEQEIEDAVSQADFDRLYLAYRRAYDGVWDDTERSDSPDPAPPRGAPVRRPRGDAA